MRHDAASLSTPTGAVPNFPLLNGVTFRTPPGAGRIAISVEAFEAIRRFWKLAFCCVTAVTVIANARALCWGEENYAMASIRTYEGWWDLSLIDERNERPLYAAVIAVITVWATAVVFALAFV